MMWQDERPEGLRVVSVSSSSKNSGKSMVSTFLICELHAEYGLKVCADYHASPIIDDPEIISRPGTDTGAMVQAGAKKVIWASSNASDGLARIIPGALRLFPTEGLLIVEGNSVLQYIFPDFAVFIMSVPFPEFKLSAFLALAKANLVLLDMRWSLNNLDVDGIMHDLAGYAPNAEILFCTNEQSLQEALQETAYMAREVLARHLLSSRSV